MIAGSCGAIRRVPEDVSQTLADYALDIERDFENLPHPQIQNVIRTLRELSRDFRGIRIADTYEEC